MGASPPSIFKDTDIRYLNYLVYTTGENLVITQGTKICIQSASTLGGWLTRPLFQYSRFISWYPATRARVLMNSLYINRDVIRSQAKLTLLCWNPCVVFKYKLILLHLMCFFLAINTSLRQLIILSGSGGVPPCCLPFGHLSHHISYQAYHAFLTGHTSFIHLKFCRTFSRSYDEGLKCDKKV